MFIKAVDARSESEKFLNKEKVKFVKLIETKIYDAIIKGEFKTHISFREYPENVEDFKVVLNILEKYGYKIYTKGYSYEDFFLTTDYLTIEW